jgi:hypothetical protein
LSKPPEWRSFLTSLIIGAETNPGDGWSVLEAPARAIL